ncbi:hypothetical protein [Fibrobacter sp.]
MESQKIEKKNYVAPTMEEIDIACQSILCGSCENNDGCIPVEVE